MSRPVRVLLCDDHLVFAEALASLLIADGIEVVDLVGRVADAVAAAVAHRPDVVLMDYELPDGNGVSACLAIKAVVPEAKVVLLTSNADEDVLVAAIEAGASGFVTKHKPAAEVTAAIRAAAGGEMLVSSDMLARLLPRMHRQDRKSGYDLTARELEVLELLAEGTPNHELAARMGISRNTVRNHVQNLLTKLGVHSRLEAVALATREGLLRSRR
ncbi:MAG: putative NarL family two-component response regulator [Actinomycetia bacterium]|nr:putative NarL family two-component response regulator [Actinomycetes bacterium]